MHRAGDVLEALLADVLEGEVEAAGGVFLDAGRDADATGLGQGFEARGNVDPIAEDVAVLDDDVADIDADAELDVLGGRDASGPFCDGALPVDRTAQRV